MLTKIPRMIADRTNMNRSVDIDIVHITALQVGQQFITRDPGCYSQQIPRLTTEDKICQPVLQTKQQEKTNYQQHRILSIEPGLRKSPTPRLTRFVRKMV